MEPTTLHFKSQALTRYTSNTFEFRSFNVVGKGISKQSFVVRFETSYCYKVSAFRLHMAYGVLFYINTCDAHEREREREREIRLFH